MKKHPIYLLCLFISICFISCKKYPENKGIHLAQPKNRIVEAGNYKLSIYTVNGEDSLGLLSSKFGQDISTITWSLYKDHQYFELFDEPSKKINSSSFDLRENDKKMHVLFILKSNLDGYNMFLTASSDWDILKLYKKHNKTTLKLKREYNGKTYIIQFNN